MSFFEKISISLPVFSRKQYRLKDGVERMRYRNFAWILLFYCIHSSIYSNEIEDNLLQPKNLESFLGTNEVNANQASNLTSLESEPSASVLGCVSVITGDYTDAVIDYTIPGPDPLPIQRVYSSGEKKNGNICYGTFWGKSGVLCRLKVEALKNKTETHAVIFGGGGARMRYMEEGYHDYKLHKQSYEKGLTNTSSGIISGRTDPLNDKLVSDKKKNWFTLTSGGGVISEFKRYRDRSYFLLQSERKPNQLKIVYNYNSDNRLTGVASQNNNGTTLASFGCHLKNDVMNIKTSNHRKISYEFTSLKNPDGRKYYLKKVLGIERPIETFDYEAFDNLSIHKLVRKNRPDGRALAIEYYQHGMNDAPFGHVNIRDKEDVRIGRVKALKAPVGHDPSLQYIYKFKYDIHTNKVPIEGNGNSGDYILEVLQGSTSVFDVYNHLTMYFYNEGHRLTCVEKYQGQGPCHTLYSREKLFWNGHKLSNRIFETKDGKALFARQHDYDSRGNIWRETLWGNLSGDNIQPIAYPASGYPEYNGCEFEFKLFTYSDDGLNLMTSMTEGKTAQISYTYHPGTDLLSAKLTGPIGSVALRDFYEYDQNGVLVLHIQDDGSSSDKNDLSGVTERRVKRILPTTTCPVGLPLIIEEKYVNLDTGYEDFIKRTVQTFTQEGWLSSREVYDQNNVFAYSERWEYDAHGNEILYQDPIGRITTKAYDANFNLIYEQGPRLDCHLEYHYDYCDRLIKKEHVFLDGQRLSEEYIFDMLSNLVATRDIYGNQTSYTYDEFGRRIKTSLPKVLDENGQIYSPEHHTHFNELSHPILVIDSLGNATESQFTIKGSPYKVVHPDGSVDAFVYNVDGTIKKQWHKNGSYTIYEYDFQKRQTKKETYSYSGEILDGIYNTYSGFQLIKEWTLGGVETNYKYDPCGRLIETTNGTSRKTFVYDSMGRVIVSKTYYGMDESDYIAKRYVFNVLNQVIEEIEEDSFGAILKRSQYEYDISGNRSLTIEHTLAGQSVTSTTYDPFGRPIEVINPEGHRTVTRYDYNKSNALGQLVPYEETTDVMGNLIALTKDALGRIVCAVKKNALGQEIQKTDFLFDANGNKIKQIDTVFNPDTTTRQIITKWQYDACNRLIQMIEADETPEQKCTKIIYNNCGQKACTIKPDGIQLFCVYDQLGRLINYSASNDSFSYKYTYDIRGNLIYVEDLIQNTSTIRHYNNEDQLIEEIQANGLKVTYTYDAMGRPTFTRLPDGSGVGHVYKANRLKEVQRYNRDGICTYVHEYEVYDKGGLLLKEKHAGHVGTSNYTYDILGRIVSQNSNAWKEVICAYDKVGNILSKEIEDLPGTVFSEYSYDDLYQLKQEKGVVEDTFQWDSLYNRIARNNKQFSYNALNQPINDFISTYTYDPNGNLIHKKTKDHSIAYEYDALDRLISFTQKNERYQYSYDACNRRQTKSKSIYVNGVWQIVFVERFLYHGQNEVGIVDVQNDLMQYRMLGVGKGAEIGASVLIELGTNTYVPLHDHNGNISCLLDIVGTPIETYRYTAFGEEYVFDQNGELIEKASNPWRFSSKRVDEETGLIYFGRRYYCPTDGRWVTTDPIGFEGGPNLYAYVNNNPLIFFDLYGLSTEGSGQNSFNLYSPKEVYNERENLFTTMKENFGSNLENLAFSYIPIPGIQCGLRYVGMVMQNKDMDEFKSWRQNKSRCYSMGLSEKCSNHRCMVAGGIDTNLVTMKERAHHLSSFLSENNVHYFYNSTHGKVADFGEWALQRSGVDTRSVKVLAKYSRKLIHEMGGVGNGGIIDLFAHSQSGEISDNLKHYLKPEELKMINVRTFGSPIPLNRKEFAKASNYVSSKDHVPYVRYLGKKNRSWNDHNIHILPSDATFGTDHGWDSATYQSVIQTELKQLNIQMFGTPL